MARLSTLAHSPPLSPLLSNRPPLPQPCRIRETTMSGGGGTTGAVATPTTRTTAATGNGTTTSIAGSSTTPTRTPPILPHMEFSWRDTRTLSARRARGWTTTPSAGRTCLRLDRPQ
eukprot:7261172-Heterocapsa_arctica.AAC.1